MTDETRAPLPETGTPSDATARAEAVIAAAERVSHLPSELCDFIREQARELAEAKQQRANTFADLLAEEEKVGELQAAASQSASGSNWQHFDAAYAKACESSEPKDWMQAALFAQQVRNAVSTSGLPSEPPEWKELGGVPGPENEPAALVAWISVKDRLPTKENEDCLLATDRFVVGNLPWKLDQHGNGAGWLDLFEGALWTTNEIAFWMPIPSLPNATPERADGK